VRRAGWRPERRNRKIGTADRAWRDQPGARTEFDLPWPDWEHRAPAERWEAPSIERHEVHGRELKIATEEPRVGSAHVCAGADVCRALGCLPASDVAGIGLVVLRQPTRKEEALRPAWGRMHWCAELDGYTGPAITLDAVDLSRPILRWSTSLSPLDEAELERMRQVGFAISRTKRGHEIELSAEPLRRWLMGRTIPHEVGHWIDYRKRVLEPLGAVSAVDAADSPRYEELLARWRARAQREREQFADRYSDRVQPALARAFSPEG
jgi:hypothetical protein